MTWYNLAYGDTVREINDVYKAEDAVARLLDNGVDVVVSTIHGGKVYETCTGWQFMGWED